MRKRTCAKLVVIAAIAIAGLSISFSQSHDSNLFYSASSATYSSEETTLAFVGDHGTGPDAWAVFNLIKREGADALVSQGDFGYGKSATEFASVLDATLGPDFPIIATIGNHDWFEQFQYQALFTKRLKRTPELACRGEIGIRSVCRFRGIDIVSATPGLPSFRWPGHNTAFLKSALGTSQANWKICNWHKNQTAVQLGKKGNSTGWEPYEVCRAHGAFIVNAHEHSYGRTMPITRMTNPPEYLHMERNIAVIKPGQTIVLVSGLGGRSVRSQRRDAPWWASVYTSTQNARPGALFCTFHSVSTPKEAQCRFVNVNGEVIDQFRLQLGSTSLS